MCIAILNPKGKMLPKETLDLCWESNPDGAGIMYAKDGKLVIRNSMRKNRFNNKVYNQAVRDSESDIVIHYRYTTHGKTDVANAHPFKINDNLGFVHNGTINCEIRDTDKSDTYHFAEILKKTGVKTVADIKRYDGLVSLLDIVIQHSKLIFMDNTGDTLIVGEDKGETNPKYEGYWFSNDYYRFGRVAKTTMYPYTTAWNTGYNTAPYLKEPTKPLIKIPAYRIVNGKIDLLDNSAYTYNKEGFFIKKDDGKIEYKMQRDKLKYYIPASSLYRSLYKDNPISALNVTKGVDTFLATINNHFVTVDEAQDALVDLRKMSNHIHLIEGIGADTTLKFLNLVISLTDLVNEDISDTFDKMVIDELDGSNRCAYCKEERGACEFCEPDGGREWWNNY